MKKKRKLKKIVYVFIAIGLLLVIFGSTYGRYIYLELKEYYLSTKNFYFNSDKLTVGRAIYQVENWSGVDSYNISINLNSYKNNLEVSDSDISYQLTYECSQNVTCHLSKNSGTIYTSTNTDNVVATITPVTSLSEGDSAFIEVTASSTSPYTKTIRARFILNVSISGLAYEIEDEVDRPYLNFNITNTLDYYTIVTPFGNYHANDKIDMTTYANLTAENKAKCKSALITLTFNPNVVVLDMTNEFYLKATNYTTTTVGGYSYINSITFNVDAISSAQVKFYKIDATILSARIPLLGKSQHFSRSYGNGAERDSQTPLPRPYRHWQDDD